MSEDRNEFVPQHITVTVPSVKNVELQVMHILAEIMDSYNKESLLDSKTKDRIIRWFVDKYKG